VQHGARRLNTCCNSRQRPRKRRSFTGLAFQSLLYYKLADELYAQSVTLNNALNDEQNGAAIDIARRLRQTILQRMSQSSINRAFSN